MFKPTDDEMGFNGLFLEGFFYGLYSGMFFMYLQYHAAKEDTNRTQNIIFYSICSLYVLSIVTFVSDILTPIIGYLGNPTDLTLRIDFIQTTSFACCDFIAQFILIYRCWIVWRRNVRVVIVPSILAFTFLAAWIAGSDSEYILSDQVVNPEWAGPVGLTSLVMSLTVNVLVMGLIVFRIFKVLREVKATSHDQILGTSGGGKLRRTIFILIESGMALFSIQLARLVISIVSTDAANKAIQIIVGIHQVLNGITPTIILVRTSMGLSFHEEKSMEEVAIGSLRFVSDPPNSTPETGNIGIVDQDNRNDDDIGIQQSTTSKLWRDEHK